MTERDKIEFERNEMAEIISNSFDHNGEKWDASDFEWSAHRVQMAGYRKQVEGEWGFDCRYGYFCTNCGEEAEEDETTPYCPFCGAKMKGGE